MDSSLSISFVVCTMSLRIILHSLQPASKSGDIKSCCRYMNDFSFSDEGNSPSKTVESVSTVMKAAKPQFAIDISRVA